MGPELSRGPEITLARWLFVRLIDAMLVALIRLRILLLMLGTSFDHCQASNVWWLQHSSALHSRTMTLVVSPVFKNCIGTPSYLSQNVIFLSVISGCSTRREHHFCPFLSIKQPYISFIVSAFRFWNVFPDYIINIDENIVALGLK